MCVEEKGGNPQARRFPVCYCSSHHTGARGALILCASRHTHAHTHTLSLSLSLAPPSPSLSLSKESRLFLHDRCLPLARAQVHSCRAASHSRAAVGSRRQVYTHTHAHTVPRAHAHTHTHMLPRATVQL